MSKIDINLVTKEDMFLETYRMILNYLKNFVNSDDPDYIDMLSDELDLQIKYFIKCKHRLLNRKDSFKNEGV